MNDTRAGESHPPSRGTDNARLDSWKKIAAHFRRDVTTVQRWERREGMPVHRHIHDKQGSVYAFRSELETWWASRRRRLAGSSESPLEPSESASPAQSPTGLSPIASSSVTSPPEPASDGKTPSRRPAIPRTRTWVLAASIAAALLLYTVLRSSRPTEQAWRNPLTSATFTPLTDWPGIEQSAEISRDGRWLAFLADHDGQMDAWLTAIGSGTYRNLTRGGQRELANSSIRTLGFSPDGSLITIWTHRGDGSRPEDVRLMVAPTAGGELHDFLPGAAEVAWSHDGKQLVYHTTAPGDPLFVRDAGGVTRRLYVAPLGVHCHFPIWSADDAYIYFARGVPPDKWDLWRIRVSGGGLERITFQNTSVSHPVLLDQNTLAYLATDPQGEGPWLYALNLERRVPHRISLGFERYTSLAVSADGTRLVATVDESSSGIWSTQLSPGGPAPGHMALQPVSSSSATGLSPRAGPTYLLYVSSNAGRQGIWKAAQGRSQELWSDDHSIIVGSPAIAPGGGRIAFTVADGQRTILYTMDSNGQGLRTLTQSLDLRGSPAWAPDRRSITSAVLQNGEPRLMNIFLDGRPPSHLVSEYSIDPVWSPDGRFLLYSGADVGTTFPLRAVASDGRPFPIPPLLLPRGARRVTFARDGHSIVVLRGDVGHKDFWLVDLRTGAERQISDLPAGVDIRDFDLSPDGTAILFDRIQQRSRIALIERSG